LLKGQAFATAEYVEQLMANTEHAHLIEIDQGERSLTIYRIRDGARELYTSVKLPNTTWDADRQAIENFCMILGENILFDSPTARKLLGI
jgi:hypothetical protein